MGREIRKVPKGWEHPKKESGQYQSMYDEYFEDAFNEWVDGLKKWVDGKDEDQQTYLYPITAAGYTEFAGRSPDPEYYRHEKWTEEQANCFQIYQTVSEGTPVSPVFESLKELEGWLVGQGHSRTAAANFCKSGWAISTTLSNGVMKSGIDTCE